MSRFVACLVTVVVGVAVAVNVHEARADVVVVRGIELQLPPNWIAQNEATFTTLRPKTSKGRVLQVVSLPAMPAAKPGELSVGGDGKLVLPKVRELDRDGVKLVSASGKLIGKTKELEVDLLAIPVDGKAVVLMSYVGADQDPLIREANTKILLSARVPGPRMKITFTPTQRPKAVGVPPALVAELTTIVTAFDATYRLPRALPVAIKDCGFVNALYKGDHTITLCHELYDYFLGIFQIGGVPADQIATLAQRAYIFTFLHEFGHALVGELALPITGRGEDAADEWATLRLASAGELGHKAALAGAQWFDIMRRQKGHKNTFYDTHSFDEQRLVTITCLLYAKDPKAFADLMAGLKIPNDRLAKCKRDYPLRVKAWSSMLAPYTITKKRSDP